MASPLDAPRPGSWLPAQGPAVTVPAGAGSATGGAVADGPAAGAPDVPAPDAPAADDPAADLAARLAGLPVTGHVEVLTAEHERLHRLLATIDQL